MDEDTRRWNRYGQFRTEDAPRWNRWNRDGEFTSYLTGQGSEDSRLVDIVENHIRRQNLSTQPSSITASGYQRSGHPSAESSAFMSDFRWDAQSSSSGARLSVPLGRANVTHPLPGHTTTRYDGWLGPSRGDMPIDTTATTLIIKNIPQHVDHEWLAGVWPPADSWNILYLPWSLSQRRHVSYTFINFISNEAARAFYAKWDGQLLQELKRNQGHRVHPLNVKVADIQGFWPNMQNIFTKLRDYDQLPKPIVIGSSGERLDIIEMMTRTHLISFSV